MSHSSNSHKHRKIYDTQAVFPSIAQPEPIVNNIDDFPAAIEEVDSSDIRNANNVRRAAKFTPLVEPLTATNAPDEANTTLITQQPLGHNKVDERIYKDIFDEMNASAIEVYQKATQHKVDYFLYGVFAGTHLPAAAWLSLAYVFALPTLLFLQNPLWLSKLRENHFAALPIAVGIMAASDVYAVYCLTRSVY